jgi:hypothetical protein
VRRSRRTGDGSAKSFADQVEGGEESAESAPARPSTGVNRAASINALFAVQEVNSGGEKDREAEQRASDILENLDQLRHRLLMGTLSRAELQNLARTARVRREEIRDPRLAEILDQIELRAEVELAKYSTFD